MLLVFCQRKLLKTSLREKKYEKGNGKVWAYKWNVNIGTCSIGDFLIRRGPSDAWTE